MGIKWDADALEIFNKVISSLPQFHRSIAERLVKQRAQERANKENKVVTRDILVSTFFEEVPPAFKEMMKRLFDKFKIDY
ncbi:MAG: hypothetical protein PHP69_03380 [Candidatus Omnitrophica bacterium]|nr:hypothetical protein [Candidatus Omnitrophota bacterium]